MFIPLELSSSIGCFKSSDVIGRRMFIPLDPSSSIGCFKAVMSLNVQRKSTTCSFSFLIGAMCSNNHKGVPRTEKYRHFIYFTECVQGKNIKKSN